MHRVTVDIIIEYKELKLMESTNTEENKLSLKEKFLAFTQSDGYQAIVESFAGVMVGTTLVQIMLLVVAVSIGSPMFWMQMIGITLTFSAYMLFKDGAKASHRTIGNTLLKVSPLIFVLSFVITLMTSITRSMGNSSSGLNAAPFVSMMAIGLIAGYFVLINHPNVKEAFRQMDEDFTLASLTGGGGDTYHQGDMVIGKRYDLQYKDNGDKVLELTEEDVIIPLKDRYLHMLIIGPTGSGKTSQVLIPQINRDIKNPELGLIVLEPKGDLAEQVYAMADYYGRSNEAVYFNPTHPDCPYFNPLSGPEDDVIENMTTTFGTLSEGSSTFFADQGEMLIRRSLSVLKRMEKDDKARELLHGDEATLLDLSTLIHNYENKGREMVIAFQKIPIDSEEIQKENDDISSWFLSDYLTGSTAGHGATKTYEHTSGMRNQVAKLVANPHLSRVLNPPKGKGNDIDFVKSLAEGHVMALTTNQGKLQGLGRFLGYFLILQLQSAIFKRPGNEDTRRGTMLFIDEFQVYANDGFEDMLTQGRSYRVAVHLATQAIGQIAAGGPNGKRFLTVVQTNCRNLIAFPDVDPEDAKWFSEKFGETMVKTTSRGVSQQKFGLANFGKLRPVNESVRTDERLQPFLTPSDIMGRQFEQISYKIMQNNSVAPPGIAHIEWIPNDLRKALQAIVDEYNSAIEEEAELIGNVRGTSSSNTPQPVHVEEVGPTQSLKPVDLFDEVDDFGAIDDDDLYEESFLDTEEDYEDDFFEDNKIEERGTYVNDDGFDDTEEYL